jgi:hypothetical protein
MNTFLFPPALLLLTVSIHGVTLAQTKHADDSLYNVASTIVSNIKAFDRTTDPKDAQTFMIGDRHNIHPGRITEKEKSGQNGQSTILSAFKRGPWHTIFELSYIRTEAAGGFIHFSMSL